MKKPKKPEPKKPETKKPDQHLHKTGRFHIDKRAPELKAALEMMDVDPLQLFDTREVAKLWKASTSWLEIGRSTGYGPRWIELSPNMIRYRRDHLIEYLDQRIHASTSEYPSREQRRIEKQEQARKAKIAALGNRIAELKTKEDA